MELFSSCKFPISLQMLAEQFDLDPFICKDYLLKWDEKELIKLI